MTPSSSSLFFKGSARAITLCGAASHWVSVSAKAPRHPLSPLSRLDIPAGRGIRSPGGSWGPFPGSRRAVSFSIASSPHFFSSSSCSVLPSIVSACSLPPTAACPPLPATGESSFVHYWGSRAVRICRDPFGRSLPFLDGGSGWALGTAKSPDDVPHKKSYPRHSPRPVHCTVQNRPSSRRGQLDAVVVIL